MADTQESLALFYELNERDQMNVIGLIGLRGFQAAVNRYHQPPELVSSVGLAEQRCVNPLDWATALAAWLDDNPGVDLLPWFANAMSTVRSIERERHQTEWVERENTWREERESMRSQIGGQTKDVVRSDHNEMPGDRVDPEMIMSTDPQVWADKFIIRRGPVGGAGSRQVIVDWFAAALDRGCKKGIEYTRSTEAMPRLATVLAAEHRDQYEHDALFQSWVDVLDNMLPLWVNGLAVDASNRAGDMDDKDERIATTLTAAAIPHDWHTAEDGRAYPVDVYTKAPGDG